MEKECRQIKPWKTPANAHMTKTVRGQSKKVGREALTSSSWKRCLDRAQEGNSQSRRNPQPSALRKPKATEPSSYRRHPWQSPSKMPKAAMGHPEARTLPGYQLWPEEKTFLESFIPTSGFSHRMENYSIIWSSKNLPAPVTLRRSLERNKHCMERGLCSRHEGWHGQAA